MSLAVQIHRLDSSGSERSSINFTRWLFQEYFGRSPADACHMHRWLSFCRRHTGNQTYDLLITGQSVCCPNKAERWLKISYKAACPLLGALWISYSLQAAIITTTNKRPLSRVLFCSASRLFQPVIRILLISSSLTSSSHFHLPPPDSPLPSVLHLPPSSYPFLLPPPPPFTSFSSSSSSLQGNEWFKSRKNKSWRGEQIVGCLLTCQSEQNCGTGLKI